MAICPDYCEKIENTLTSNKPLDLVLHDAETFSLDPGKLYSR